MRKFLKATVLEAYSVKWMLLAGVVLGACNFFNPTGSGDPGDDTNAQMALGQSLFRDKDFRGSMKAYEKAIAQDSSNSLAYYGFAKATMKHYGLSASSILDEVNSFNQGGNDGFKLPFVDSDDKVLTNYLQATSRVRKVLRILTDRDSLTRWYDYSRNPDSKAASKDALSATRIAFIEDYFSKAEKGTPGFRARSKFPLSDRVLGADKIVADFGLTEMLYALVHLRDLDGNDSIDSRDNLIKKLNFSSEGGFKIDNLKDITDDLKDPETRDNLNTLIRNTSDGMASAGTIIKLMGSMGGSNDSLSNSALTGQVTENIDSVITSLGSAVGFYQFGDGIDNDGDGCIDEEILDGIDNDGDGFVDEDARLELVDGIDNNRDGSMGPEDLIDLTNPPARPLVFTQHPDWKTGPKYQDKDFRVKVQADSARTQSIIDSAKEQIGGCWHNY